MTLRTDRQTPSLFEHIYWRILGRRMPRILQLPYPVLPILHSDHSSDWKTSFNWNALYYYSLSTVVGGVECLTDEIIDRRGQSPHFGYRTKRSFDPLHVSSFCCYLHISLKLLVMARNNKYSKDDVVGWVTCVTKDIWFLELIVCENVWSDWIHLLL